MKEACFSSQGFTLIELSIVLVIIGLLVGGVLVGRELIQSAEVQGTIEQINNFNQAMETFQNKYNAVPGDMSPRKAAAFGFAARSGNAMQGDGNGLVETTTSAQANPGGTVCCAQSNTGQGGGETGLFWVDLSTAQLIAGSFGSATDTSTGPISVANIGLYLPQAKMGHGNYIYIYPNAGRHYYGLSAPSDPGGFTAIDYGHQLSTNPGLSVAQAANMDKKTDDGFPLTGATQAVYLSTVIVALKSNSTSTAGMTASANASPAVVGDCFDSTTTAGVYAAGFDSGNDIVCSLSFRAQ